MSRSVAPVRPARLELEPQTQSVAGRTAAGTFSTDAISHGGSKAADLRSAAQTAAASPLGPDVRGVPYAADINAAAHKNGLPPTLLAGLIKQESRFDPNVVSNRGAVGLTQLEPATARSLGVANAYDPAQNIEGGAKYLKAQIDAFGGNVSLGLAAYNAGPGNVRRYGGIPPFPETQSYVRTVEANAAAYAHGGTAGTLPVPNPATHAPARPAANSAQLMQIGARGAGVRSLQEQLGTPADGDYGPKTEAAVEHFQRAHRLETDGIVGPQTRAALAASRPEISEGATGSNVRAVQTKLGIAADGDFGPKTKAAVQRFQRAHGLAPDGVVGPKTWAALDGAAGSAAAGHPGTPVPAPKPAGTAGNAPAAPGDAGALAVAHGQLGETSKTGARDTDNGDGRIRAYQAATGAYNQAWCASFVSWVMEQSHANTSFRSAGVGNWVDAAHAGKDNLRTVAASQVEPGDIVAISWDDGNYHDSDEHIGIVSAVNKNGTFSYISGNAGSGGTGSVKSDTTTIDGKDRLGRDLAYGGTAAITFIHVGS